jgi:hypothetical protein
MGMPGKPGEVIAGPLVPKIIEQQKRVELVGFSETEAAMQLDTRAFHGWSGCGDAFNRTDRHEKCSRIFEYIGHLEVSVWDNPFLSCARSAGSIPVCPGTD